MGSPRSHDEFPRARAEDAARRPHHHGGPAGCGRGGVCDAAARKLSGDRHSVFLYLGDGQRRVARRLPSGCWASRSKTSIKDLDGLLHYTTTATQGFASVLLEFDANANKDKAEQDVRAKMDGIGSLLPTDATTPIITAVSTAMFPSISVAVYGDVPQRALQQKAKDLQDALQKLPDVQSADLSGSRDEMLAVTIDSDKLEAYGLTAAQLLDALAKNNLVVPGGTLDTGHGSFNVEVPGLITTPEDVYSLPLKTSGDTVVTFGDVAQITRTFKDATSYADVNGQPAITLSVVKKLGTNVINVVDQVKATTTELTSTWPAGIQHSFLLDQSETAKSQFNSLQAAVLTAVALVMIVCVAALGIRPALMIGTSIPISFMIAFLVTSLLGMTLNMMIMFGLVLAVGVLVDDPIVVVEYAERKLQEGVPKRDAFIMAARKMFVPVVSATATTLCAFVILLFWPGIIGKFMSYLPIIVIVVMGASLLSALVFMPVIGALVARTHVDPVAKAKADIVMYPDKFDTKKVGGFTGVYVRVMSKLLHYPLVTLPIGLLLIVAAFMFAHPSGVVLFPDSEPEQGTVDVIARGNYSPVQIRDFLREVENKVLAVQGIQDAVMSFGGGQRLRRQRAAGHHRHDPAAVAAMGRPLAGRANLPGNPRQDQEPARARHRDRGRPERAAIWQGHQPQGREPGLQRPAPCRREPARLRREQARRHHRRRGRAPLARHRLAGDDRPRRGGKIWHRRARAQPLRAARDGRREDRHVPARRSRHRLDIRVRLPQDERSFEALDSLKIATADGQVPVSNFIKRTPVQKVATIGRYDGDYSMTVAANLKDGVNANAKVQLVKQWEQDQIKAGNIPSSVHIVYGGEDEQNAETGAFIVKAFIVALAMIALVLLLEYNSFWQVFITISTVGMSLAGVMIGLAVTHTPFSMIMTGLGVVALAGIVVKNGIVLTDTYNHYNRDDGVEPVKAMLITISQRVRPVLLTATVTALGVIPMALNVEFDFIGREITVGGLAGTWFTALSTALVSGLFVSTSLTLILVPVMIVAPKVAKHQIGGFLYALWTLPGRLLGAIFGRRRSTAITPEGEVVDIPAEPAALEGPAEDDSEATRHAAE